MTAAISDALNAYHKFVQQALQEGCSVEQATPAAFERYRAANANVEASDAARSIREVLSQPTVDEQLAVARQVMEDRHDALRKLAE